MYSMVLMAAMTTAPETASFGNSFWQNHCFFESCAPARYGWTNCPGTGGYYPGCGGCGGSCYSYTPRPSFSYGCSGCSGSCHGCYGGCYGGYSTSYGCWGSCHGYSYTSMSCSGCTGYSGCYGCYGGKIYNELTGVGYSGFSGAGNFGQFGYTPVMSSRVDYSTDPVLSGAILNIVTTSDGTAVPAPGGTGFGTKDTVVPPTIVVPSATLPISPAMPSLGNPIPSSTFGQPAVPTPAMPGSGFGEPAMPTPSKMPRGLEPIPAPRPLVPTNFSQAAPAKIVVNVPANALVYVGDQLMKGLAGERTFETPAIPVGKSFFYEVKVISMADGKMSEEIKRVVVRGGEVTTTMFDGINRDGPALAHNSK